MTKPQDERNCDTCVHERDSGSEFCGSCDLVSQYTERAECAVDRLNKQDNKMIEQLQAKLETAERLLLQGTAGHDAIVKKATDLQAKHNDLLEVGGELKDALNRVLDNIEGTGILGRFTSHTVSLAQQHWDKAAEGAK